MSDQTQVKIKLKVPRLALALRSGSLGMTEPTIVLSHGSSFNSHCAAELRSAWTGEDARPHV